MQGLPQEAAKRLALAARHSAPVSGATHCFYRYPARFSPVFARAAIETFSQPGDLVLDPYMGGGTTVVEAMRTARDVIGNDLNSLSVFITRVKTTLLRKSECQIARCWAANLAGEWRYSTSAASRPTADDRQRTRNMSVPRARFIKKLTAAALVSIDDLRGSRVRDFLRCAILRTGQWALDGKRTHTTLDQFRRKLVLNVDEMLTGLSGFREDLAQHSLNPALYLRQGDATSICDDIALAKHRREVDLVVTSPPYPGVHVLYHRWQIDGRRETAAPYWIAGCSDGQGAAFYNFGDRHEEMLNSYFDSSLRTLISIRQMLRRGGKMIQLISFSDTRTQLPRYLENMETAGFAEVPAKSSHGTSRRTRIWRSVPGRKWHAILKGDISSSREVVLVHRAK